MIKANQMMIHTNNIILKAFGNKQYCTNIKKKTIGFIGLGQMGFPMAINLNKANYDVIVYDENHEKMNILKKKCNIKSVNSPKEIALRCNTIISMLPSTSHVKNVYTDPNTGILSGISNESLLIDSSTISPTYVIELANIIKERHNSHLVDAPVSGGVNGATAGTLTFMVGGSEEIFNKAKSILSTIGKNIVHCGPTSTGQVAKICNNLALAIEMIGVSEAMTLGDKLGINPKTLANIMNTSSSQCWSSSVYNPYPGIIENAPSNREYEGGFASKLMRKDLGLALDAAGKVEASVPLTSLSYQIYNLLITQGNGEKDFSFVLKFLQGEKNKK